MDAVFHLAAVVSGAAEADFDLGMKVNFDATRSVLTRCRRLEVPHRRPHTTLLLVLSGLQASLPNSISTLNSSVYAP